MFPGQSHHERNDKTIKTQEEMVKIQKRAIRINPDDVVAYNNLAVAYGGLRRHLEALKVLKQAIRIKPDSALAYYNLGIAYDRLGRWRKAVKAFEQAIKIEPDNAEVYCAMGEICNKLGWYREAINALEKALQLKPDYSEARQMLVNTRSIIKVMKLPVSEDEIHKDPNRDKADLSGPAHK
jgi:tetratricopeptide (TPR) repeat protein